jgi:outer membrane biosynthesis protein TonB
MQERLTPDALREMTGVSALPRPVDKTAMLEAVKRHYPVELRGRAERALVLVDASIDANGTITDVEVVQAPAGDVHHRAVVVTRDPVTGSETQRTLSGGGAYDPAFGPAAQAAVREVRFTPALRDGQAVPFRMRMSVEFTP